MITHTIAGLQNLSQTFSGLRQRAASVCYEALVGLEARQTGLRRKYVDIGDMRMATFQRGPASRREALILVHGYTADKTVWIRFARKLSKSTRIVIPDLAGHGENGWDATADFSVEAQAARLLVLMDRLRIDKAVLIGNSMGGAIAATFAADYPQRTAGLVVINPGGVRSPDPSPYDILLKHGKSPFLVDSYRGFRDFYAMTMAKPPFVPAFILRELGRRYQERKTAYARIGEDLTTGAAESRLGNIQVPTQVIWGDRDVIIDVSAAEVWREGLRHGEVQVLNSIGHMPMVECPAATARIVQSYLNGVAPWAS